MLYEAAYPGLWVLARARYMRAKAKGVAGGGLGGAAGQGEAAGLSTDNLPETYCRVVGWKIRKFEIEALARLSPAWAAAKALERFEITRRPKQRKRTLDYMAEMRLSHGQFRGGRVDIRCAGPQDGPKLLLVHGWNATGPGLAPLIDGLTVAGYQVFAPDLPGHGTSEGSRYAFQELGQALAEACNGFGPFEAVIGHSAGGLIAGLALQKGLKARRLVTLSAPGSLDGLLETYLLSNQLPAGLLAPIRKRYARLFGATPAEVGPPLFAGLDCPVLAVQDERDWMIAKTNALEIAGAARQGEAFFTRAYSHLSILRAPEFHTELLRFLASAPQGEGASDA